MKLSTLFSNAGNTLQKNFAAIIFSLIMAIILFLMPQHSNAQVTNLTQKFFAGIIVPQYMGSGTATRLPVVFKAKITAGLLTANTTYRYFANGATYTTAGGGSRDTGTTNPGAGNPLFISADGTTYTYSTGASLTSAGNFGTFTTDANGEYVGWFAIVNTGNARFTAGNFIHLSLSIGTGAAGTLVARLAMPDSIRVLQFNAAAGANNGSFIQETGSSATAKNIVALYDNVAGNGRPLAVTCVENIGVAVASEITGYSTAAGSWNTIIPNTNANGVKRIEQFNDASPGVGVADDQNSSSFTGTINPTGGVTAVTVSSTSAPLNVPSATTISSPSTPANSNISINSANNLLYELNLAITSHNATDTGLIITTAGTYAAADLTNLKLWYAASTPFNAGTATLLATKTTSLGIGTDTFSTTALTARQIIASSTTGHLFVTADIAAGATLGHSLNINAVTLSNVLFTSGSISGSTNAGGSVSFINASSPTKLAITLVSPANPVVNTNFNVTIQSQTSSSLASNVNSNTTVLLTNAGGGTLGGTTSQTINAGSNQITFNNLTLSSSTTGVVLTAHVTSGDVLSDATTTINVLASVPTTLASNINFGSVTYNNIPLTWTSGNGTSEIVVARKTTTAAAPPSSGTAYTVNSNSFSDITNGTTGTGNVVVYNGVTPNSGLTVTGLAGGTGYTFDIYEYNGSGVLISYSTAVSNNTTTSAATYTWNTSSGNWSSPASWTPARSASGSADILVFDGSIFASPTVTVDVSDNFGQITFKNNVTATLTVGAAKTLTVNGDGTSATDFVINSGSTLNATNSGAFALTINITTGATGQVDGTANFNGTAAASFKLEAADANGLIVNGTVVTGSNFSSNLFGSNGNSASGLNSVIFNSGSTYVQGGGANPFGASAPSTVVIFNPGSNFKFVGIGSVANPITPSIASRTYANFEYNAPGNAAITFTNNSNPGTITGNLLISGGTFTDTAIANTLSIGGNITVNVGDTFKYYFAALSHPGGFTLNGTSDQTITNNGTFILGTGLGTVGIVLKKTSGDVKLGSDLTLDNLTFNAGNTANVVIGGHTLTFNGAALGTAGGFAGSYVSNIICNSDVNLLNFVAGADTLHNLTLSNSSSAAEIGTPLAITAGDSPGTITVADGATLVLDDSLTLKSDVNGTARIDENTSGSDYIFGDVTVERYIPANSQRAWRLLSIPTQTGQSIHQSWQENQAPGVVGTTGLGTNITSPIPGNGFDYVTYHSSMLKYNQGNNSWDSVTNTGDNIATTSGYFLYIRGDRNETPSVSTGPTSATTLRTIGGLYQGDQSAISVPAGEFGLIGNVYASAIDFTKLTKGAGIDNLFYVWDPKVLNLPPSLGAYVTFSSVTTPSFIPVPGGGSYTTGVQDSLIQSGEAFFVHASSTDNIQLTESSKVTGSQMVFRPEGPSNISGQLATNLYEVNGTSASLADGNVEVFNSAYSDKVDGYDALKLSNTQENFGILRNNKVLIIEARQPVATTDTIFFDMWNMKQQQYKLEFIPTNLNTAAITGVLEDSYLGTRTPINLTTTNSINFSVDGNAGSSVSNRFRIVFNGSSPVPVTFTSVSAYQKDGAGVEVEWKVAGENGIQQYVVEHSTDGVNFTKIGVVTAKNNNGGSVNYNLLDGKATNGANYYRISSVAVNGSVKYTSIVKVTLGSTAPGIAIYPNPVTDGHITVELKNQPAGSYSVRLLNTAGQLLYRGEIIHNGGSGTQTLNLPSFISKGIYQLEVITPANETHVEKLTIINKN